MTPRELAGEASRRARSRISRAISLASDSPQTTYVSDADLQRSLGGKSIAEVASTIRTGRENFLTSDGQYSEEFLLQIASWYEDNPPRFGVNWSIAMEAGIRAVNVITALEMFRGSPNVTDRAIELILKMLIAHGRFIRANLEFSHRTPSNHYLSDLIVLFTIGPTAPALRQARVWR